MFISKRWTRSHYSKEAEWKISAIVANPTFWNRILFGLTAAGPFVKVLPSRWEKKKPPRGYIYKVVHREKEAIALAFDHDENKDKEILKRLTIGGTYPPTIARTLLPYPDFFYLNPNIWGRSEVNNEIIHMH